MSAVRPSRSRAARQSRSRAALGRSARWTSYVLAGLFATIVLIVLALATTPGRDVLANLIQRAVHVSGITIAVTNISGWPPFHFGIEKVVVHDVDGPFAEIDKLEGRLRFTDLFRAIVSLESLGAERVAVLRAPKVEPSTAEGDMISVSIDKFSIARLELAEALTGQHAMLAVAGSYVSRSDGHLRANVNANRADGKTGNVNATIVRTERKAPLVLDAKLDEGADGILVALLGQESGPAYRIAAKTEAKALAGGSQVLEGTLQLASSGAAQFDGRFSISLADAKRTLVAKGNGNLGELLPVDLSGVLSGPVEIAIDADWMIPDAKAAAATASGSLPRIVIREGTLRSATLRAQASGRLDDAASDLALKLEAGSASGGALRIPRVAGAQLRRLDLAGQAAPVDGVMRIQLDGTIDGFAIDRTSIPRTQLSLGVSSAGRDPLAGGKLPFKLRIEADRVDTPAGRVAGPQGAAIVLTADGTLDTAKTEAATRAALSLGSTRIGFDGLLAANGVTGKATASATDLRALAAFAGGTLSGALEATADGTFASASGTRLSVTATGTDINPGNATLARLLAGKSSARLNLALNRTGVVSIANLALDANALKASGNATLSATTVDANIDGRLADLSVLARDTQGAARFAVKASGARNAPALEATLRVDQGRLLGKPVEQVNARLEGRPGAKGWSGRLALDGRYNGKRIEGGADASIDTATNALDVPRVDIAVGEDRIRGALRRSARGLIDGTLDVAAPDIGSLAALALVDVSGSANAKLTFSGAGAQQKLALTFTGSNVKTSDIALGTAAGTLDIDDLFGTPRLRGNVDATNVAAGGLKLDLATARATFASGATRFTATAKNADLDLSGSGTFAEKTATAKQLTIEALNGSAYRVPLRLAAPAAIDFDGDRITVRGINVAAGGGSLKVDGAVAPALDVTIVADRINASLANVFAKELGAEGTLSGRASVTGKPDAPAAAWQVNWNGMRLAATKNAGLPALALTARGNATNADTTLDAQITGAGASFTINGKLPYAGGGVSLAINGNAPLALLALESNRELRLGGNARVNVTVTGELKSPQIAGAADLVEATVADTETGFGITGATGRIVFNGQRATLEKVTGRLLQGGQVSVGGTIDIAGKDLPASLEARVDNGRYADGKIVNTTFSGRLAIDGPLLAGGTVTGSIALGRTEIQLPDRFGGAATAIEVKHVHAKPGFRDPLTKRERTDTGGGAKNAALKLAIELTNNGGIFVRGFGVDAEFGGALRLAGTIDAPEAIGAFTMRRGRLDVLGKRFDLATGRLTFAGELVPLLDFRGTTSAGDTAVTLTVSGPASDPAINMTSSPELPQEEIMSRLLFERSVGTLSPLQAVQLIDAVARFTGVNRGSGVFDRIRKATGLDDLDIRQNASGQTTVGVGRRLSDRVRLGVEAGTGETSGRVAIDLEITKNLKARGEAGQEGSGKIGLTYEREY